MHYLIDNLKNYYSHVRESSQQKLIYICLKSNINVVEVFLNQIILAYDSDNEIRKELDKGEFFNKILNAAIHTDKQWLVLLLSKKLDLIPEYCKDMKENHPHLYQQFVAIYEKRNLFMNLSNEKEDHKELISCTKL